MTRKTKDLCVKVGEYPDGQGGMKPEWRRVGVVMENDQGNEFLLLHRDFNPAGVPNPENRSTVMISMFEPRDNGQGGGGRQQRQAPPPQQQQRRAPAPQQASGNSDNYDDDIPF